MEGPGSSRGTVSDRIGGRIRSRTVALAGDHEHLRKTPTGVLVSSERLQHKGQAERVAKDGEPVDRHDVSRVGMDPGLSYAMFRTQLAIPPLMRARSAP